MGRFWKVRLMPQHDFAQEVIDQQQLDFEALANELDTSASSSEGLGKGLGKGKAFVDGQGQGPSGWREKCAVLVILAPLASFRAFQNTFQNSSKLFELVRETPILENSSLS